MIVIKHYSKLAISIFLVISMSCTKNLEKETLPTVERILAAINAII